MKGADSHGIPTPANAYFTCGVPTQGNLTPGDAPTRSGRRSVVIRRFRWKYNKDFIMRGLKMLGIKINVKYKVEEI